MPHYYVKLPLSFPFAHLHIAYVVAINGEADSCANAMEAILAGCAGIDVQQRIYWVIDNLQDMGMTCHKDVRL